MQDANEKPIKERLKFVEKSIDGLINSCRDVESVLSSVENEEERNALIFELQRQRLRYARYHVEKMSLLHALEDENTEIISNNPNPKTRPRWNKSGNAALTSYTANMHEQGTHELPFHRGTLHRTSRCSMKIRRTSGDSEGTRRQRRRRGGPHDRDCKTASESSDGENIPITHKENGNSDPKEYKSGAARRSFIIRKKLKTDDCDSISNPLQFILQELPDAILAEADGVRLPFDHSEETDVTTRVEEVVVLGEGENAATAPFGNAIIDRRERILNERHAVGCEIRFVHEHTRTYRLETVVRVDEDGLRKWAERVVVQRNQMQLPKQQARGDSQDVNEYRRQNFQNIVEKKVQEMISRAHTSDENPTRDAHEIRRVRQNRPYETYSSRRKKDINEHKRNEYKWKTTEEFQDYFTTKLNRLAKNLLDYELQRDNTNLGRNYDSQYMSDVFDQEEITSLGMETNLDFDNTSTFVIDGGDSTTTDLDAMSPLSPRSMSHEQQIGNGSGESTDDEMLSNRSDWKTYNQMQINVAESSSSGYTRQDNTTSCIPDDEIKLVVEHQTRREKDVIEVKPQPVNEHDDNNGISEISKSEMTILMEEIVSDDVRKTNRGVPLGDDKNLCTIAHEAVQVTKKANACHETILAEEIPTMPLQIEIENVTPNVIIVNNSSETVDVDVGIVAETTQLTDVIAVGKTVLKQEKIEKRNYNTSVNNPISAENVLERRPEMTQLYLQDGEALLPIEQVNIKIVDEHINTSPQLSTHSIDCDPEKLKSEETIEDNHIDICILSRECELATTPLSDDQKAELLRVSEWVKNEKIAHKIEQILDDPKIGPDDEITKIVLELENVMKIDEPEEDVVDTLKSHLVEKLRPAKELKQIDRTDSNHSFRERETNSSHSRRGHGNSSSSSDVENLELNSRIVDDYTAAKSFYEGNSETVHGHSSYTATNESIQSHSNAELKSAKIKNSNANYNSPQATEHSETQIRKDDGVWNALDGEDTLSGEEFLTREEVQYTRSLPLSKAVEEILDWPMESADEIETDMLSIIEEVPEEHFQEDDVEIEIFGQAKLLYNSLVENASNEKQDAEVTADNAYMIEKIRQSSRVGEAEEDIQSVSLEVSTVEAVKTAKLLSQEEPLTSSNEKNENFISVVKSGQDGIQPKCENKLNAEPFIKKLKNMLSNSRPRIVISNGRRRARSNVTSGYDNENNGNEISFVTRTRRTRRLTQSEKIMNELHLPHNIDIAEKSSTREWGLKFDEKNKKIVPSDSDEEQPTQMHRTKSFGEETISYKYGKSIEESDDIKLQKSIQFLPTSSDEHLSEAGVKRPINILKYIPDATEIPLTETQSVGSKYRAPRRSRQLSVKKFKKLQKAADSKSRSSSVSSLSRSSDLLRTPMKPPRKYSETTQSLMAHPESIQQSRSLMETIEMEMRALQQKFEQTISAKIVTESDTTVQSKLMEVNVQTLKDTDFTQFYQASLGEWKEIEEEAFKVLDTVQKVSVSVDNQDNPLKPTEELPEWSLNEAQRETVQNYLSLTITQKRRRLATQRKRLEISLVLDEQTIHETFKSIEMLNLPLMLEENIIVSLSEFSNDSLETANDGTDANFTSTPMVKEKKLEIENAEVSTYEHIKTSQMDCNQPSTIPSADYQRERTDSLLDQIVYEFERQISIQNVDNSYQETGDNTNTENEIDITNEDYFECAMNSEDDFSSDGGDAQSPQWIHMSDNMKTWEQTQPYAISAHLEVVNVNVTNGLIRKTSQISLCSIMEEDEEEREAALARASALESSIDSHEKHVSFNDITILHWLHPSPELPFCQLHTSVFSILKSNVDDETYSTVPRHRSSSMQPGERRTISETIDENRLGEISKILEKSAGSNQTQGNLYCQEHTVMDTIQIQLPQITKFPSLSSFLSASDAASIANKEENDQYVKNVTQSIVEMRRKKFEITQVVQDSTQVYHYFDVNDSNSPSQNHSSTSLKNKQDFASTTQLAFQETAEKINRTDDQQSHQFQNLIRPEDTKSTHNTSASVNFLQEEFTSDTTSTVKKAEIIQNIIATQSTLLDCGTTTVDVMVRDVGLQVNTDQWTGIKTIKAKHDFEEYLTSSSTKKMTEMTSNAVLQNYLNFDLKDERAIGINAVPLWAESGAQTAHRDTESSAELETSKARKLSKKFCVNSAQTSCVWNVNSQAAQTEPHLEGTYILHQSIQQQHTPKALISHTVELKSVGTTTEWLEIEKVTEKILTREEFRRMYDEILEIRTIINKPPLETDVLVEELEEILHDGKPFVEIPLKFAKLLQGERVRLLRSLATQTQANTPTFFTFFLFHVPYFLVPRKPELLPVVRTRRGSVEKPPTLLQAVSALLERQSNLEIDLFGDAKDVQHEIRRETRRSTGNINESQNVKKIAVQFEELFCSNLSHSAGQRRKRDSIRIASGSQEHASPQFVKRRRSDDKMRLQLSQRGNLNEETAIAKELSAALAQRYRRLEDIERAEAAATESKESSAVVLIKFINQIEFEKGQLPSASVRTHAKQPLESVQGKRPAQPPPKAPRAGPDHVSQKKGKKDSEDSGSDAEFVDCTALTTYYIRSASSLFRRLDRDYRRRVRHAKPPLAFTVRFARPPTISLSGTNRRYLSGCMPELIDALTAAAVQNGGDASVDDTLHLAAPEEEATHAWDATNLLNKLYHVDYNPLVEKRSRFRNMEGHLEVPKNEPDLIPEIENEWKKLYFRTKDGRFQWYATHFADEHPIEDILLTGTVVTANRNDWSITIKGGKENANLTVKTPSNLFEKWVQALLSHSHSALIDAYVQPVYPPVAHFTHNVVLIELGSAAVRAGVLTNRPSLPQVFFPSVGCLLDSEHAAAVGIDAFQPEIRQRGQLQSPIQASDSEKLIERYRLNLPILSACLQKIINELNVHTHKYKVLLSIPQNIPSKHASELLRTLVRQIGFKAASIARQPSLVLYSYDVTTGVVVDIGERLNIVPIIDEYIVDSGIISLPFGAPQIRKSLQKELASRNQRIRPFNSAIEQLLLRHIVEQACYVAVDFEEETKKPSRGPTRIDFDQFKIGGEGLFKPKRWGLEMRGIHQLIHDAIQQSPIDSRRTLYRNIYVSGGTSLLSGLCERLENEITKIAPPSIFVQVHGSPWRQHAAYLGSQVIANSFQFENCCAEAHNLDKYIKQMENSA